MVAFHSLVATILSHINMNTALRYITDSHSMIRTLQRNKTILRTLYLPVYFFLSFLSVPLLGDAPFFHLPLSFAKVQPI